jgi:hypothetical protein
MDRLALLLASTTLNGIDFVEVHCQDETHPVVHFLNTVPVEGTLTVPQQITISGGESVPAVPVQPVGPGDWSFDEDGRPLLRLTTPYAGDFSTYQLSIGSGALDPYYARASFSFKAECPSTLDCTAPPGTCPLPGDNPQIDYLAKDFNSFRKALSDYSARAYPGWVERDEADAGTMLLELLSSVADDLSYQQDRIAAEATIATCTQRRSLVRHARLVDYEPAPAASAQVMVQVDVASGPVPAGALLLAPRPDGSTLGFEVGVSLMDPVTGGVTSQPLTVDPRWNAADHGGSGGWRIVPYYWDDSQSCLTAGATEMWVQGWGFGFPVGDPLQDIPGLALLIDTAAPSPLDAPIREVIHLTGAHEETDPLTGTRITHLTWGATEALKLDHDLTDARTHLAGNLLPASEGRRSTEQFTVTPPQTADVTSVVPAVARTGPGAACGDTAPIFLHTLLAGRLAWLNADPEATAVPGVVTAAPELVVTELPGSPADEPVIWQWRRSLLQSLPFESSYTIDPVRYTDIRPPAQQWAGFPRFEYDGDNGDSIRFGDGDFGNRPAPGTAFQVVYRTTSGAAGNVGPDSITGVDPAMSGIILSATNPFPAVGGSDEEPAEQVKNNAPYAFRAVQYRAVRSPDYVSAAVSLPWVQNAGSAFRWTGSWLTVFTTPEPTGGGDMSVGQEVQLIELLDRRRLAGYESYALEPRYVGFDLIVTVCAVRSAFRSDVSNAIRIELGTGTNAAGAPAFFAPSRWSFGDPLERSVLEAATQQAVGVKGVVSVQYRRRGVSPGYVAMPPVVTVGADEIVEVRGNPSRPDLGSLRIVVEGGK